MYSQTFFFDVWRSSSILLTFFGQTYPIVFVYIPCWLDLKGVKQGNSLYSIDEILSTCFFVLISFLKKRIVTMIFFLTIQLLRVYNIIQEKYRCFLLIWYCTNILMMMVLSDFGLLEDFFIWWFSLMVVGFTWIPVSSSCLRSDMEQSQLTSEKHQMTLLYDYCHLRLYCTVRHCWSR